MHPRHCLVSAGSIRRPDRPRHGIAWLEQVARARRFTSRRQECREPSLRVVFAVCALCFALAIYSGHHIVSETHLHTEPSPIPGVSRSPHRESIAALEQEQRIRASRLGSAGIHPSSTLDTIMEALGGH